MTEPDTIARIRQSMRRAIGDAVRREAKKAAKGKPAAKVTVTLDQLMAKLSANGYRCAVTGLPFWQDDADISYRPTSPSLDPIKHDGDYSGKNTRVVLHGVNSIRGRGSDADMLRIAKAIVRRGRARR